MTEAKGKITTLFVAVGALFLITICARIFFSSGLTYSFDGACHSAKSYMVYQSIREGDFPLWSNLWHTGFAFLQFYPPLFYFLAGILNLLFNDIVVPIKILIFLAHVLSGFSAYLLVKEISDSHRAGLVAGLAYSLSPWHVFHIIIFNRFPASFIYTFLPLLFYFYEQFRKGKKSLFKASIATGFILFIVISFQYGYALFCTYFFLLFVLLDSFGSLRTKQIAINTKFMLCSGLIAVGLSLFMLLPFVMEGGAMFLEQKKGINFWELNKFNVDSATFETLYTRKDKPIYHKGYIGIGFAILSLFGVIEALRKKRFALIILYGFAIFLVLGHETSLYRHIPLIYSQKGTDRLIIYQIFFMAILAGFGWNIIEDYFRLWKNIPYLTELMFVLMIIFLIWDVSVMFNIKWGESYIGLDQQYKVIKQDMEKRKDLTGRVAHLFNGTGMDWVTEGILQGVQVLKTRTPSLWGFASPFEITRSGFFISYGGRGWLRDELNKYNGLKSSVDFLHLMDTAYLILVGPDRTVHISLFTPHTPVFASGNISFMNNQEKDSKTLCSTIIPRMSLNRATATAQTLFSLQSIPEYQPLPPPHIKLLEYKQTINRTYLKVQSDTDTYLRIAHSYYQYLDVALDKKLVSFYPTTLEFILIRFPAGTHTIDISPVLSPLRKATLCLSMILFFVFLFFYFKKTRATA